MATLSKIEKLLQSSEAQLKKLMPKTTKNVKSFSECKNKATKAFQNKMWLLWERKSIMEFGSGKKLKFLWKDYYQS